MVYKDANQKIEQITKLFAYGVLLTKFNFMMPALFTIFYYNILDLGEESFILIFPAWYVSISGECKILLDEAEDGGNIPR